MNNIYTRVSIRKYQDRPVEKEKTEAMLRAAMQAPSAANQQPWEFYVVTNEEKLGKLLGKEPVFAGEEGNTAYINNASLAMEIFGYPDVCAETLIRWQAEYILDGGRTLNKPTHFEERKGNY